MIENDPINKVISELSRIIPNEFLAYEFFLEVSQSQYHELWNTCFMKAVKLRYNSSIDIRTNSDKSGQALGVMCQELMKMSNSALYNFILFLIESYCRNRKQKVSVKGLRKVLRSMGILDFSALNQYAEKESLIDFISDISDWNGITEAISKINKDCFIANSEMEYQNIGNSCRNLVISVAQIVFRPEIHGKLNKEGKELSKTDAIGMLTNYFTYNFSGSSNELYRKYAKAANDLANMLTHKRNATKRDMLITVSATLSLVNIIGIIEGK
jgi:hypothetical protein